MPRDVCTIYNKKDYIAFLQKAIPEEGIVIGPSWGLHGDVRADNKKKGKQWQPAFVSIRASFAPDALQDPYEISGLMEFSGDVVFWMNKEKAAKYLNYDHIIQLLKTT